MRRLTPANDTQIRMMDKLSRTLRERFPAEAQLRAEKSGLGFMPELWADLAREAGVPGAALPECCGGAGGGLHEHALIMEALGYALAAEPYLSTAVIGAGLLRRSANRLAQEVLQDIAAGQAVLAFAATEPRGRHDLSAPATRLRAEGGRHLLRGHKAVVRHARGATHLLVTAAADSGGLAVVLIEPGAPGVSARHYLTVDSQQASECHFADVEITPARIILDADAAPVVRRVIDEATIALCAEAVGVMRRLFEDTVDHVRRRKQFGSPLAAFQAVQHRIADMLIRLEQAAAITDRAALAANADDAALARLASSAKVTVAAACRLVGQSAIQLHGGIGMTDGLALGRYFRRATVIEGLFGAADHHLRRVARLGDAPPAASGVPDDFFSPLPTKGSA